MEENIKKIVKTLIQENYNLDISIIDSNIDFNIDSNIKCTNKAIMFQHEKIDKILNNITVSNLYNYNFKNINKFSVIYQYSTINVILRVVNKFMDKIKNMVHPILMEYNKLLNTFDIREDKIIINRFNLYYFYKLIINVLNYNKRLKKTMMCLCKYVKTTFYIDDKIFDKYKNKLIDTHNFIQIYLHDLSTKLEDIY